jgi:hypothetical protein
MALCLEVKRGGDGQTGVERGKWQQCCRLLLLMLPAKLLTINNAADVAAFSDLVSCLSFSSNSRDLEG